jgi:GNAT superfamily N-acetyltransferase
MQFQIYDGSRLALLPLFRLADESESQILSYYETGSVLVAWDGNLAVGMAHIVNDEMTIVIVSLAVVPERQGQGIGKRLIEEAINYCRLNQTNRLVVCTGSWETNNIVFYLRRGFRIFNVVRDYFTPEKGYATSHCDQVQLEMNL